MPVRNQGWYNLNESRSYPISDEATGLDDAGTRLPAHFIADLHLSFPDTAGRRAMISAVTVNRYLVTVIILAADDVSFTPLAALSLSKSVRVDPHRQYPLDALYPGTRGWIVLGSAATDRSATAETYSGRFSTAAQSLLLPNTARAYRPLPVTSAGLLGSNARLTGLVRLKSGNDIEIVKECREIPLHPAEAGREACDADIATMRDVIVIRLNQDQATGTAQQNLFDKYRGACSNRPESHTCGDPAPIELLNAVSPDCCGNIDIVLRGCMRISEVTEHATLEDDAVVDVEPANGILLACEMGLSDVCVTRDRLPTSDGTLPNEFTDLCESVSELSVTLPDENPDNDESLSRDTAEEDAIEDPLLPYCDDFTNNNPDLVTVSGLFDYDPTAEAVPNRNWQTASDTQFTNLAYVDIPVGHAYTWIHANVTLAYASALRHNAAVIGNYRETSPGSGLYAYYFSEIDWDASINGTKRFRIGFFNGTADVTLFERAIPELALEDEYQIHLFIYPDFVTPATRCWVNGWIYGISNPFLTYSHTYFPRDGDFTGFDGKNGFRTIRSSAVFHEFCIRNLNES